MNSKVKLIFIFFVIAYLLLFGTMNYYRYNDLCRYIVICFPVVMYLYYISIKGFRFDFFHPVHIYFVFYIFIYYITPLVLVNVKNESCFGVNVMGGCIKATLLTTIGLIFFCFGYRRKEIDRNVYEIKEISENKRKKIIKLSYFLFFFFFTIALFYASRSGKTLVSILSFGTISFDYVSHDLNNSLLFLINVNYALLVPWLFLCAYSNSKIMKIFLSVLMASIFFSYGWRFVIFIMVISFLILNYRMNKSKPSFLHIVFLVVVLVLYSTVQGVVRNSVRTGQVADFNVISEENIAYTLESNFNIYQSFYGLVQTYPQKYDYYYGEATIVSPIVMWIPRSIWNNKPLSGQFPSQVALNNSISDEALISGFAYTNIYEYYLDFGFWGIVFISFILGIACKWMIQNYNSPSLYNLIFYALFLGFLIQFINRGFLSQLFSIFTFLFFPLLLYRKYYRHN